MARAGGNGTLTVRDATLPRMQPASRSRNIGFLSRLDRAGAEHQEVSMTPDEAGEELVRMFNSGPPTPPGKDRHHHLQYDLVRLDDGTIGFVRNAFDAEMKQVFAEIMMELFGPAPPEDLEP
jgi:hypothetical protein